MYSYKSLVDKKASAQLKGMKNTKRVAAELNAHGVGIGVSSERIVTGEFAFNPDYDYNCFEESLHRHEGQDYFDFVMKSDEYEVMNVPAMKLLRLNSTFFVPEQFDLVNLIEAFRPMLMEQIETRTADEREALNSFLGKASADIPIVLDCGGVTICGKLNGKNLYEDYSSLEEYADQEVTFLCKVVGVCRLEQVEIFNPLRDFIRLNRTLRRSLETGSSNDTGLEPISVKGPVVKVEVIAIYK